MGLLKHAVLVAFAAFVTRYIYKLIVSNGIAPRTYQYPSNCRVVHGIECGSEKISLASDGLAFMTSHYCSSCGKCGKCTNKHGGIYLFDFHNTYRNATRLTIINPEFKSDAFIPLGMDILESEGSDLLELYVINHDRMAGESIEVFAYNRSVPHELNHVRRIAHEKFRYLNDITLLSENKFYTTNFWKYPHRYPYLIEYFIPLMRTGNVLYYDNGNVTIVENNGNLFNGLTLSHDKQQVIVNMFGEGKIRFYNRHNDDGMMTLQSQLHVGYQPDNVYFDKTTGALYVAAIPNLFSFLLFKHGYSDYCSSYCVKILPLDKSSETLKYGKVEEVLRTDGKGFVSGVSSVVHYQGQYLFGTVFDKLGYCSGT